MAQKMKTGAPDVPGVNRNDRTGDGDIKDLVSRAAELAEDAKKFPSKGDERRQRDIRVDKAWNLQSARAMFYINEVLWAEIDYSAQRKAYCIQDATGYCLNHTKQIREEIGGPNSMSAFDAAIERTKQMIRDGSMPTPEEARLSFKQNYGRDFAG